MKAFLLLSFLVAQFGASAQELLANGSFEDKNVCTEYGKDCAPEAWLCTAQGFVYYFESIKRAGDGVYFCGVIVGSPREMRKDYHSFLYSRLLCRLRKGNHYRVSFSAWSNSAVFDSLGVYFNTDDFLFEKRPYWQIPPAFLVHEGADTLPSPATWRTFNFDYTATGAEDGIVLGSFKHKPFRIVEANDPSGNFYLYIDKVSMQALDPHELMCKSADSMKTAIYNSNERHDMLEKKRRYYRNAPPRFVRAQPTIEQRIDTLLIPDILFASGSATLAESSHRLLDSFCTAITAVPADSLVIEGHTDSMGSLQYNSRLSANRANAVEKYLRMKTAGFMPRVYVRYHAFLRPVASNATPEGRTRNRRVEMFLYRHED